MRRPLVIANWKMHGNRASIAALLAGVKQGLAPLAQQVEVAMCPAFVHLAEVAQQLQGGPWQWGAQDLSPAEPGAHTGDVAGEMLRELGCHYVIVGHSERRLEHGENDALVAQKYQRALACGLQPVLCVGESLAQREAGQTLAVVAAQLDAVLPQQQAMVIAYEPVWAIGTGKTATATQAQEVHQFIRQRLGASGRQARLLYGGSVRAENAAELFNQADIDGGLIGGASLEVAGFVAICRAAGKSQH